MQAASTLHPVNQNLHLGLKGSPGPRTVHVRVMWVSTADSLLDFSVNVNFSSSQFSAPGVENTDMGG